jgi:hypothetical protein
MKGCCRFFNLSFCFLGLASFISGNASSLRVSFFEVLSTAGGRELLDVSFYDSIS